VESTTPDQHRYKTALVKVEDLARDAEVHQECIRRLYRAGKLPMVRVGGNVRIPREAAEALLAGEL
jgi:excisionase family DNA binding protein